MSKEDLIFFIEDSIDTLSHENFVSSSYVTFILNAIKLKLEVME